ncbi:lymphotactin-like [Acomys russatus]|uniref:lymphotactin-like n=1 Tax=Acomys russatus TaxID=60746 RepID=UPI0021E2E3BD|nr:lymphotactin-like [Acomys russatus]
MRLLLLTLLGICCLTTYIVAGKPSGFHLDKAQLGSYAGVDLRFDCNDLLAPGVGTEVLEETICVNFKSQPLPVQIIKTYSTREGIVKAIIFVTKGGRKYCADPQVQWVKDAVKSVDSRSRVRKSMAKTIPKRAQRTSSIATSLAGK